jgi:N-methylhydantoinase A
MPSISPTVIAAGDAEPPPEALAGRGPVVFAGADGAPAEHDTPFLERSALRSGNVIAGPAIVEQLDSTTVVPPGATARVLPDGAIIIDLEEAP